MPKRMRLSSYILIPDQFHIHLLISLHDLCRLRCGTLINWQFVENRPFDKYGMCGYEALKWSIFRREYVVCKIAQIDVEIERILHEQRTSDMHSKNYEINQNRMELIRPITLWSVYNVQLYISIYILHTHFFPKAINYCCFVMNIICLPYFVALIVEHL